MKLPNPCGTGTHSRSRPACTWRSADTGGSRAGALPAPVVDGPSSTPYTQPRSRPQPAAGSERGNAGSSRIAQLQWPVVSSVRFTLSLGPESLRFRCLNRIPHTLPAEVIPKAPPSSKSPDLPGFSISGAYSVHYAELLRVRRSAPQMSVRCDVDVPRDPPALGRGRDRLGISLHGDVPMEARRQCVAGYMKHVPAVKGPRSEAPRKVTLVPPSGPRRRESR